MASDRDIARARIAHEGLTQTAVERIARTSLGRLPITMLDRARAQLRRFFSDGTWSVEDDAGLSGIIGPGTGWTDEELAPGIRLGFGWRGNSFRIDVDADAIATGAGEALEEIAAEPQHERTLGDTFEDSTIIEGGRDPVELRFVTGPATTGGTGSFTRDEPGDSPVIGAFLHDFDDITKIRVDRSSVVVTVSDGASWPKILLPVFDALNAAFVPPRAVIMDRQQERAISEMRSLGVGNPRDLARILDATTSPDAASRTLAMAKLETADPLVVQKPWTRALEDSSRAVRRAAIRAMAFAARTDLRLLFERALGDKDACVRYYGLRGLGAIGVGRADDTVKRLLRDDDIRVRIAAEAALGGHVPA